jgi:hypothetical protein
MQIYGLLIYIILVVVLVVVLVLVLELVPHAPLIFHAETQRGAEIRREEIMFLAHWGKTFCTLHSTFCTGEMTGPTNKNHHL